VHAAQGNRIRRIWRRKQSSAPATVEPVALATEVPQQPATAAIAAPLAAPLPVPSTAAPAESVISVANDRLRTSETSAVSAVSVQSPAERSYAAAGVSYRSAATRGACRLISILMKSQPMAAQQLLTADECPKQETPQDIGRGLVQGCPIRLL